MKVLVVDDKPEAREFIIGILMHYAVNIQSTSSGQLAIKALKKADKENSAFDLVLLDWKMPGLDGLETVKMIRLDKNLKQVPTIIMVTAYEREALTEHAKQTKLDGIFTKPVDSSKLIDGIMNAFGNHENYIKPDQSIGKYNTDNEKNIHNKRVLLVEDNVINQQVARELLEELKLSVIIANNGIEALSAIKKSPFDLVLMDLQMPEMDGFQTTSEIRRQSKFDHLPIIAITAQNMTGDKEKCLSAGMNDHLAKPIEPEKLFPVLNKWLNETVDKALDKQISYQTTASDRELIPVSLPGIDQEQGLNKIGYKYSLYRKLLKQFYDDHQETTQNINHYIDKNDHHSAQILAHTLKGVSGNLGALELFNAAAHLEQSLKKHCWLSCCFIRL